MLDIVERENLIERARATGDAMLAGLRSALAGDERVVDVRGRGMMLGVELVGVTSAAVVAEALRRDVWIYPAGSGPAVNDCLVFAPPLVIEPDDVAQIVDATAESIAAA